MTVAAAQASLDSWREGTLIDVLCDPGRLQAAYGRVAAADGAPGVDGVSTGAFGEHLEERLAELTASVADGGYRPSALLALRIPKDRDPRGRELLVPTVADRVLQRAVHDLLSPAVEARLLPCVHGFRPGHSVRGAVRAAQSAVERRPWVADADVRDFFPDVPHERVLAALAAWVSDPRLLALVSAWLAAPAVRAGRSEPRDSGLPLGAPLSPLLANVVLHPLDLALWRPDTTYIRFADDLLACCEGAELAREQLALCARTLAEEVGVRLNEAKSRVVDARRESLVFLGHLIRASGKGEPPARERPQRRSLHLVEPGSRLSKRGGRLVVTRQGTDLLTVPLRRVRDIVVLAPVDLSSAAVTACLEQGIDIAWLSGHGRWWGSLRTWQSPSPELRRAQTLLSLDGERCLRIARGLLAAKVYNQKRLLQRQHARRGHEAGLGAALEALAVAELAMAAAADRSALLGAEGGAARAFFSGLGRLLDPSLGFAGRVRRPPTDPVNSLLSFGYVLLTQEMDAACHRTGLDGDFGVLHQPRTGRPSLALDLVEELRAVVVDSLVVSVLHRRVLRAEHFCHDPATGGVRLKEEGRRVFLREYELRILTLFTHEPSGERVSYRRALVLQAEQFARTLRYPGCAYVPIRMS